jgi:hypothetical protein
LGQAHQKARKVRLPRYVLHANGDANRELILTVLAFHVPR